MQAHQSADQEHVRALASARERDSQTERWRDRERRTNERAHGWREEQKRDAVNLLERR